MMKTITIAVLAVAMSAGLAQAHKHYVPACAMGQATAATCSCGTVVAGKRLICHKGQWCHINSGCTS
jgi:putative Mn2+ efflux pump MntP